MLSKLLLLTCFTWGLTGYSQSDFVRQDAVNAAQDYSQTLKDFIQYADNNDLTKVKKSAKALNNSVKKYIAGYLKQGVERSKVQSQLRAHIHPGVAKVWKAIQQTSDGQKTQHVETFRYTEIYKLYLIDSLKHIKGDNQVSLEYNKSRVLKNLKNYIAVLDNFIKFSQNAGHKGVSQSAKKLKKITNENVLELVKKNYAYTSVQIAVIQYLYPAIQEVWVSISQVSSNKKSLLQAFKETQGSRLKVIKAINSPS